MECIELLDRYGYRLGAIHDFVDLNEETDTPDKAIDLVARIASLSYGNSHAKSPHVLFHRIVANGHLSCTEFIPFIPKTTGYNESKLALPYLSYRAYAEDGNNPLEDIEDFYSNDEWEYYDRRIIQAHAALIECPIPLARQIMRHRSFSFLEMSRRYVKGSKVPFTFWGDDPLYAMAVARYEELLSQGVPPEVARRVIPQGAMTRFWMGGFDRDWQKFFKLRIDKHAQTEVGAIASAVRDLINASEPYPTGIAA
jgi:thymidylate synthase (FAD)